MSTFIAAMHIVATVALQAARELFARAAWLTCCIALAEVIVWPLHHLSQAPGDAAIRPCQVNGHALKVATFGG